MAFKKLLLVLLFLFTFTFIQAQVVLEVAAKTIEKMFAYNNAGTISIISENASIKINSWEKNEIKLILKLIAKHRIKTIAIEELNNIKYVAERKGEDIYLRNYFLERKDHIGPGSILKVEYELTVPKKATITINNNLGNIHIKNITGKITIDAKFGNIDLSGIKANVSIHLSLGDITIMESEGITTIKADHSTINMENISGKCTFKLINSDLFLKSIHKIDVLNVETKNGDVTYFNNDIEAYNYSISAYYGSITVPPVLKKFLIMDGNKSLFEKKNPNISPMVTIKSEYGNTILTK